MPVDWKKHIRANMNRLGESMNYTRTGDAAATIVGIYIDTPSEILGIDAGSPVVECIEDDVPAVDYDDTFLIRGVTYKVKGINHDPVGGFKRMKLERQDA